MPLTPKLEREVARYRKARGLPEVQERLHDTWWLLRQLKVRTKLGALVNLELRCEQEEIVAEWLAGMDLTIAKARQIGCTTIIAALFFIEWLRTEDPILLMQLAHKADVAREILKMHRVFLDSLPPILRPPLLGDSKTELVRADCGARLAVDTARGDGGLRSLTVHRLHISEYAFCPDPGELRAASMSAVPAHPNGRIVLESTANFRGDALHQEFTSDDRTPTTTLLFFPWSKHDDYRAEPAPGFTRTAEEDQLVDAYGLDDQQLQWRRNTISRLKDPQKFRREYPLTLDDAYSGFSGQWLDMSKLPITRLPVDLPGPCILRQPEAGHRYLVIVDCSAGVGADPQACLVLDVDYLRPCMVFADPKCASSDFAGVISDVSRRYRATVVVERNHWSDDVITLLQEWKVPLWYRMADGEAAGEPGFVTTDQTRRTALATLRRLLETNRITEMDTLSVDLLSSAKVAENGKIEFPRKRATGTSSTKHHGDLVMCWAIGVTVAEDMPIPASDRPKMNLMDKHIATTRAKRILASDW